MSRPNTLEDIEEYNRAPHGFITVDTTYLMRDLCVGHALLALLEALRNSTEFDLTEEANEIKATIPLTEDEKAAKLRSAQSSWDTVKGWYDEADEKPVESWRRYSINSWAKGEGLEPIDWEQHDAIHKAVSA